MDCGSVYIEMLDKAIGAEPSGFISFDRTKNVQDQLQEMVGGFEAGFIDWFHWRNAIYPHIQNPFNKDWKFTSMEQLWLAFVMKERYQKIWNGTEWIKNDGI